jgi:ADP-heptose:LPS heptosyltransferase
MRRESERRAMVPSRRHSPGLRQETPDRAASEVRSMLVIHQGALGDFILALPALMALRKSFPRAKPVIMGYPRILELVEKRFYAEEIVPVDQRGMASFFVQGGDLDPGLSRYFGTFDLIVVFGKEAEGSILTNLERVSRGQIMHLHSFPPPDERIHLTDHLLRELRRNHVSGEDQDPRLFLNRSDQAWGRGYCKKKGLTEAEKAEAIVLHPGSGSRRKAWPMERFSELLNHFRGHTSSSLLVVVGPAEAGEVEKSLETIPWETEAAAPVLIKDLSLIGLASVIEGCRVFIGNDSGITHMAAALGVPTVAIFGPTDPKRWAPRGKHVAVVRGEVSCAPCSREKFLQCQDAECLNTVEVGDVLDALSSLKISL